jgi:transcriptional regulator with XRE-family HTH domain
MDMREKLWAIKEAKGWLRQDEIAAYFGVGQSTASRWMSGKSKPEGEHRDRVNTVYEELRGPPAVSGIEPTAQINDVFRRLPPAKQRMAADMFRAVLRVIDAW